jgi:hypothetical protein
VLAAAGLTVLRLQAELVPRDLRLALRQVALALAR